MEGGEERLMVSPRFCPSSNWRDTIAIDQDKETQEKVWEVKSGDQTWICSFQDVEWTIGYERLEFGGEVLAGAVHLESLS